MSRGLAWGHVSRRCARCGKVGPRTFNPNPFEIGLYVHKYCLTDKELRAHKPKATQQEDQPC